MKRLLLAAAGLSVIAGPMAASAQSQQDQRDNHPDHQNTHQAPPSHPQNRPAPQTNRAPPQNVQRPGPNGAPARAGPNGSGQHYGNSGQVQTYQGSQNQYRNGSQYQYRNGGQVQTYQGGQNQYRNGSQYQYRNGGQYANRNGAENYRNWSGSNFRLSGNWWHGRPGFNGYYGRRQGYWYAPGWGYYQVDPAWWGVTWAIGSIVPYQLQSYYVSDYWDYGLPAPPYGCGWIYLGDQIVLIDLGSGQILQIAGAY